MKTKSKSLATLLLAGAATTAFSLSAHALPVTIDLFNDPVLQTVTDTTVDGVAVTSSFTTATPGQIVGDVRDLSISLTDDPFSQTAGLNVTSGFLNWVNGSGSRSQAIVQWDGTAGSALNPTGLGGINLLGACGGVGCTTINAILMAADLGFNYQLRFYSDASNYTILSSGSVGGIPADFAAPYTSSYDLAWLGYATGSYFEDGLPFDILQVGTGANLTNLGAIEFMMENPLGGTCFKKDGAGTEPCRASVDITLNNIGLVPEPGSLALLGLGLAGLAGLRRRKAA